MKIRKLLTLLVLAALMLSASSLTAFADDGGINVFVTISTADGKLALAREEISVTDSDGDGKLTVNDALFSAHELKYEGKAAAGYAFAESEYGVSLTKLWGVENGGAYGYYVNNESAMSLSDELKDGDRVNAFVYTDTASWSDTYCYFDTEAAELKKGGEITLTLYSVGFAADYSTLVTPVSGAAILIDGESSEFKTDADGRVTLTVDKTGRVVISAESDAVRLVPPVCVAEVKAGALTTVLVIAAFAVVTAGAVAAVLFFVSRKAKNNKQK